jgi:hypothetical protein
VSGHINNQTARYGERSLLPRAVVFSISAREKRFMMKRILLHTSLSAFPVEKRYIIVRLHEKSAKRGKE